MSSFKGICVYSEISDLKKVLVHTPGEEINNISPSRLDELLFSAILEPSDTISEHKKFISILEKEGVEVVQLVDLVSETYEKCDTQSKNEFIDKFISEIEPVIKTNSLNKKIKEFLLSISNTKKMVRKMMSGIFCSELDIDSKKELLVDPMPNLYFTRDPFASIGSGVSINKMKYVTRRRETIFCDFIFSKNNDYKSVPQLYSRNDKHTIEGGDIFIYNEETLVIGVSERTKIDSILKIANNLKSSKDTFKYIYAINVPKMTNLMHLDTWLTMIDYDKFLYSPNMMGSLKIWTIDLNDDEICAKETNSTLENILHKIINKKPILIPVAGDNAKQIDIDIETHFDATNYLVIKPSVVVGYDRNKKTNIALKKAGVVVHNFKGNQLSLGMGSARCMSMPLVRNR